MYKVGILIVCLGIAFAQNAQLTEQEIEQLTKYMQDLEATKTVEAANYQPKNYIPARFSCVRDADCPLSHNCIDIPSALYDVLKASDSLVAYDYVRTTMGIEAGECIENLQDWLKNNATAYIPLLENELDSIHNFVDKSMGEQHLTSVKVFDKVDYEPLVSGPMARAGQAHADPAAGFSDILPLLILMQSGTSGLGESDDLLLYLMLMNGEGGSSMLNNPLLLLALASEDSSSSSSDSFMEIILLSSLFDSQNGMGSVMPLFLLSSLGESGEISDMLPLLLMTNMFSPNEGSQNDAMSQLLPLILLNTNDGTGDFLETFLMISVLGSLGGNGRMGGFGNDMLPLLLLFGGSNDSSSDGLMSFILLSFFGGSSCGGNGGSDILPLLMLLGDGGLTGSSGMDISSLALILSMGNMGPGGLSNILPLLLMSDSGNSGSDISDLLLISVLGGQGTSGPAGDISNLLLPLMLGGDSIDSTSIVMLLLLSSSQTVCTGPVMPMPAYPQHVYPAHAYQVVEQPAVPEFQETQYVNANSMYPEEPIQTGGEYHVPSQLMYLPEEPAHQPIITEPHYPMNYETQVSAHNVAEYPYHAVNVQSKPMESVPQYQPIITEPHYTNHQGVHTDGGDYQYGVYHGQPVAIAQPGNQNQLNYIYPVTDRINKRSIQSQGNDMSQFFYFYIIKSLTGNSGDDSLMSILLLLLLSGNQML